MKSVEDAMEEARSEIYHQGIYLSIVYEDISEFASKWADKIIAFSKEMGEDMKLRSSEPKVKSCYTCAFFGETGNPRCTNAQAVVDAPWETRDPPRSAVLYDKGCELFQSSDGKAIEE